MAYLMFNAQSYLVQGESAYAESGQLDGVQQGDLGHAVCLRPSARPILITLNLNMHS